MLLRSETVAWHAASSLRTAPRLTTLLLLGSLLTLTGCESLGVALGLRTRLDHLPVTGITLALSPAGAVSPGGSAALVIVARTADGKSLATVGAGGGKVLFDSFSFETQLLEVNAKGKVSLPQDPRTTDAHTPHLHVTVVGHPEVSADLEVPLRYDVPFVASFSGHSGRFGTDGMNGMDGTAGMLGSIDPNSPLAGGNGSSGSNGGDGSDGGPGEPGQSVHVWMTLRAGARPLLEVRAMSAAREQFFLIDPAGGSLSVEANGGAGGRGGSGGRGGRGGAGGTGSPDGLPGGDGLNGSDGRTGPPGAAGVIEAVIDPQARPYVDRLRLVNHDGAGRPGPTPQVQFLPVPPLW